MSADQLRDLCAELADSVELLLGMRAVNAKPMAITEDRLARARALLAEAQPVSTPEADEPTDEQLQDLSADFSSYQNDCRCLDADDAVDYARAVLARWGRSAPEPVSVTERMPTAQDCNEEGEVWVEEAGSSYAIADTGDYGWDPHRYVLRPLSEWDMKRRARWLPHWALPAPQEQADE
jgi:hypothetical protein